MAHLLLMQTAIRLTRNDPALNVQRFYRVSLEPTLFGEWALRRHWGRIDTQGRCCTEVFALRTDAARQAARTICAKAKRGSIFASYD